MKTIISIAIYILFSTFCFSQEISHISISSTGGNFQNSDNGISVTIGELVVESLYGDSISLGHGFPTPDSLDLSSIDEIQKQYDNFKVYPNPTNNLVTIEHINNSSNEIYLELIDNLGKVILTKSFQYPNSNLEMKDLNQGIYYLKINNVDKEISTFYKIIKTN